MKAGNGDVCASLAHRVECSRAEDFVASLPSGSVNLLTLDPPYHRVKMDHAWDRQWKTAEAFLDWMDGLAKQWRRVLAPNGSIYVFASPQMGARVEVMLRKYFAVLCNIRWRKDAGWHEKSRKEDLRTPFPASETVVFAEQYGADSTALGASGYDAKCDELRGFVFEPLRAYLDGERERAGFNFDAVRAAVGCAPGSGLPSHWFTKSQWMLPTEANYERLRAAFNARGGDFLRRQYEDLRRQYEDLRRPFLVTAEVPYTDVWDFPTVQSYPGKHACEKPPAMGEHIVRASSRPGDVVADFFSGSGTFLAAAAALGRIAWGCDMDEHWATITRDRVTRSAASGKVEPAIVGKAPRSITKAPSKPVAMATVAPKQLVLF